MDRNNGHPGIEELLESGLVGYIKSRVVDSIMSKRTIIEPRMLKLAALFKMEYPADLLAAIRQNKGSEAFYGLIFDKIKKAVYQFTRMSFQGGRPWEIKPATDNDIAPDEKAKIEATVAAKMANIQKSATQMMLQMAQQSIMMGQEVDMATISAMQINQEMEMQRISDDEKRKATRDFTEQSTEKLTKALDAMLIQGDWYTAVQDLYLDFFLYPACFMKGTYRQIPVKKRQRNATTGSYKTTVEDEVHLCYERVDPFNVYPMPLSKGIGDGYVLIRNIYSREKMYKLIGVPGFQEDTIRKLLNEHSTGTYHSEWLMNDSAIEQAKKREGYSPGKSTDNFDMAEFWGTVRGELLIEWGYEPDESEGEIDSEKPYPVCIYYCGGHILKVMLNPDPMGKWPLHKASVLPISDSFWGVGLGDVLLPFQSVINMLFRNIHTNAGIASGPIGEYNQDRMPPGKALSIAPWMMMPTTEKGLSTGTPAIRFTTIPMVIRELLDTMLQFLGLADEVSLSRAVSGESPRGGGAMETATGYSGAMSNTNTNVECMKWYFDKGIVIKSIEQVYNYALFHSDDTVFDQYADLNITTKGSIAISERQMALLRLQEFARITQNPIDLQIIGTEGRAGLLEKMAALMDLPDIADDFDIQSRTKSIIELMNQANQANAQGQAPQPAPGQSPAQQTGADYYNGMNGGSPPTVQQPQQPLGAQQGIANRTVGVGENAPNV